MLSQISDSQTYVRTIHKLMVFNPTSILVVSSAASPKSKLFSIIEDSLEDIDSNIVLLDRRYWAETVGIEYIQQLAFAEDVEAIKTAVSGNYYAVCCFAAVSTDFSCNFTMEFRCAAAKRAIESTIRFLSQNSFPRVEVANDITAGTQICGVGSR